MSVKNTQSDRGRIEEVLLTSPIIFNGNSILKIRIEIDHINFGINKKTRKLNLKRRTNFTVNDVIKFLRLLHNEDIEPQERKGSTLKFAVRINCPVQGRFFDKEFLVIFDTFETKKTELHTITIVPGW
ncbi:MAG: hypothetical protein ACLGG7_10495 [Bacteriovoracia bacterium]